MDPGERRWPSKPKSTKTTAPTPQHAIQWRTERSKEHPKQKPCTKPTLCKCPPHQPSKNKAPPRKRTPAKKRPTASRPKNMPDTHTLARNSIARKPTQKPTKGREPTEPKIEPNEKPRPVHSEIYPSGPARPNHGDPSDPPPLDRIRTDVRNQKQVKEPESDPEPPTSKRCLSPPKANHSPLPQKKTYTNPNIQTTSRTHKTLDAQVDFAPPLPTDLQHRQQNALPEGESTCSDMVPTCQFRRPLIPPMHQRPLGQGRVPGHASAQNPVNIPARIQAPQAQPGPFELTYFC
ncbi:hypothetical protein CRENBAI_001157 [Crenichthys baileyi]|uniref:Uncharacterized protein n=1 Tax=Crenichthys baileyi TaxID=28760 RepID=A0AAV9RW24_9TELE